MKFKRNVLLVIAIAISSIGCERMVDGVVISNNENREYFKSRLEKEGIPFRVVIEKGEKVLRVDQAYSKRVNALYNELVSTEMEPGLNICYKDAELLNKETGKFKAANVPYKLVRNYAFTCLTWKKEHSKIANKIIYQ